MRKTRQWHSPFNCSTYLRSQVTRRDHKATWVICLERNYQIQPRSKALLLVCLLIGREIFPPRIVRLFTVNKFSPLLIILHHCLRLLDTVFKVRPRLLYMEKGWPAQPCYPGQANSLLKSWRGEPSTSEKIVVSARRVVRQVGLPFCDGRVTLLLGPTLRIRWRTHPGHLGKGKTIRACASAF